MLDGTPSIFTSPPRSYMEEIRTLTLELVASSTMRRDPPSRSITIKNRDIEVVDSIAYRTVVDTEFLKVKYFWADADIHVDSSIVVCSTWFFISEGSSNIKQDGKIVKVGSRDVVYFKSGDTFGGFTLSGDLRGVKVTMEDID